MLRVLDALENEVVEYVLIGAAAMGVHGVVRENRCREDRCQAPD